jgi:lipoate-protein ligase A
VQNWRFIPYSLHDAATNMAVDEAMLESHLAGETPPTVRLYGFDPAAMTLGYAQKLDAPTLKRIRDCGFDLARRPTGGRAVLHLNEITYSFVGTSRLRDAISPDERTAEQGFLAPTILGAYKQICQGLIFALEELGVSTALGASNSAYRQVHDCFLATTSADLHYLGTKMVGSAQCRRGQGVLQHGSVLLNQDQSIMEKLLTGSQPHAGLPRESARHANLFDALNRDLSIDDLAKAIRNGFERAFEIKLVQGELTSSEICAVQNLRDKFLVNSA